MTLFNTRWCSDIVFVPWRRCLDCIWLYQNWEKREKTPQILLFCATTDLCFFCILFSLCLFKHAQSTEKKVPPKPKEVSFTLFLKTSATFWSAQTDSIFFFCSEIVARKKQNVLDFGKKKQKKSKKKKKTVPCFLSISLPLLLPLSRMSSISWTQKIWVFFRFLFPCRCDFKVVSLAFTVCVWSTQRLGFSRNRGCWLSCLKKERRKCCFYGTRGREREKKSVPSPPCWWKCVCVCVCAMCVNVCVLLCANSQRAETTDGGGSHMWRVETLYLGHLCVRRVFLCPLLFFSSSSPLLLPPCLLITATPWTPPPTHLLPFFTPTPPLQHTSKEREKKLVHSWFGKRKKRLNKKTNKNV